MHGEYMHLVLSIKILFYLFSISATASSSETPTKVLELYHEYILSSCMDKEDCLDFKKRKMDNCTDEKCRESLLSFEEIILEKCKDGSNDSGCLSQYNFSMAMCADFECIDVISSSAAKDLNKVDLEKIKTNRYTTSPSQGIVSVKKNVSSVPKNSTQAKVNSNSKVLNVSPKSISPIPSEEPVDVQKQMMNLSKTTNEDKCRTIECLEKIEAVYSKLTDKDAPNVEYYSSKEEFSHIPKELIQIYVSEGPWSQKMYSYFKSNQSKLGVSEYKYTAQSCEDFREKDCSSIKSNGEWIYKVQNYFRDDKLGGKLAKELYKLNYTSENKILCNLRFRKLPKGKNPFKEQVKSYTGDSPYYESLNPYFFSASSKLDCLKKMKVFEQEYISRLKELGNFPSRSSYAFVELGKSGQIPAPVLNYIRGDCHSYIYIPTKDENNPELTWLQNSSNKRVLSKKSYKNLTRNECRFMANKDLYQLDASKWEEYIFFMGNVPFARFSSKAVPQYLSMDRFQKFPRYSHISAPKCRVSYKKSGSRQFRRDYDLNEKQRDCLSICKESKDSLKGEYSDYRCTIVPEMNSNPMFGFDADIFVDENKGELKSCEYYNYHWSKKPIRSFLAANEEECLSMGKWDKLKTAQEYLDYYRIKKNGFYDLEIKFNEKSILNYVSDADCTMGNLSRIGGRVSKYIRSKKITVKNEKQCHKACLDYKSSIESIMAKSPVFISCEIGRAAYTPLTLNFKLAESYDPFIALAVGDSNSREYYFKESFKELWHGYPYIEDLASDN